MPNTFHLFLSDACCASLSLWSSFLCLLCSLIVVVACFSLARLRSWLSWFIVFALASLLMVSSVSILIRWVGIWLCSLPSGIMLVFMWRRVLTALFGVLLLMAGLRSVSVAIFAMPMMLLIWGRPFSGSAVTASRSVTSFFMFWAYRHTRSLLGPAIMVRWFTVLVLVPISSFLSSLVITRTTVTMTSVLPVTFTRRSMVFMWVLNKGNMRDRVYFLEYTALIIYAAMK